MLQWINRLIFTTTNKEIIMAFINKISSMLSNIGSSIGSFFTSIGESISAGITKISNMFGSTMNTTDQGSNVLVNEFNQASQADDPSELRPQPGVGVGNHTTTGPANQADQSESESEEYFSVTL
jgi:hypothetical protein